MSDGKITILIAAKMSDKPTWFLRIRNFTINAKEIFIVMGNILKSCNMY